MKCQREGEAGGAATRMVKRNDFALVLVEKSIRLHAAGPAIVLNQWLIPLDLELGVQDEGLIGKDQRLAGADELIGSADNKQVGTNELLGIADK